MSDINELEIIDLAIKGDKDSFGVLVKTYERMVYNVLYQVTNNSEDTYDLSQDVFIKAFRAMKNFRGDCKFSTWLYKICNNAAKDYIRDKSKHRTVSLTDYSEEDDTDSGVIGKAPIIVEEDVNSKPEDAYELLERREMVHKAIACLSDDHKRVLILRDIEGYSYEDMAQILGLEIGTVKSRLNRARLAVKEYLLRRNII